MSVLLTDVDPYKVASSIVLVVLDASMFLAHKVRLTLEFALVQPGH